MHPDHVPDPRRPLGSTSGEAPAPREVADAPDIDDRRRDLSAFLPRDTVIPRTPGTNGEASKLSSAAALSYEEAVARVREVWADVLGADSTQDVPLDVSFLEFGGNSLLLVMLWEELQPIAGRPLKLSELFHHGTVQAQADLLTARPDEASPAPQNGSQSLLARRRAAAAGGGVV